MTTIACDGKTVAADTQYTICERKGTVSGRELKLRRGKGCIYAIAGSIVLFDTFIRWYESGAVPEDLPQGVVKDADYQFVIFTESDIISYNKHHPVPEYYSYDIPFAAGSGSHYALGAMCAGANSKRAVEIAGLHDIASSGLQGPWTLPGARKRARVK